MSTSMTATSGRARIAAGSASSPLAALPTISSPGSPVSRASSEFRKDASSSTSRIRIGWASIASDLLQTTSDLALDDGNFLQIGVFRGYNQATSAGRLASG